MPAKKKVKKRTIKSVASPSKKDYNKLALALHKKLRGKLEVVSKGQLTTMTDWSTMYTPGVGAVSSYIAKHPKEAKKYTAMKNMVAVVSDGSAVLGLGNIGPVASLPVMEGKCAILKEMANVEAIPVVLDVHTPDEIVAAVKAIAPTYGAINLEDIAAPQCFEIEERLRSELDIPVMHDDQHGTAIVVLAGLINASKVVGKELSKLKVVIVGAGAAGRAIALMLLEAGIKDVIVTDSKGVISKGRSGMAAYKHELAKQTNPREIKGEILDAAKGADVIVGVSGPGSIARMHVEYMADDAIVFALANPIPEISIKDAQHAGARIVATGRSDFPNQVNNSLAFPGIFRGALDKGVNTITDKMKLAAAKKLASLVKNPTEKEVIPHINTPGLVKAIASVIK